MSAVRVITVIKLAILYLAALYPIFFMKGFLDDEASIFWTVICVVIVIELATMLLNRSSNQVDQP